MQHVMFPVKFDSLRRYTLRFTSTFASAFRQVA